MNFRAGIGTGVGVLGLVGVSVGLALPQNIAEALLDHGIVRFHPRFQQGVESERRQPRLDVVGGTRFVLVKPIALDQPEGAAEG